MDDKWLAPPPTEDDKQLGVVTPISVRSSEDETREIEAMKVHRRLSSRQVHLSAIAGTVGAALFVSIGGGLYNSGPLALLLGFMWWATVIFATAQCQLETVTYFPWDGSFIRIAGRCVDTAFGAAASFNYLFLLVTDIIFELTIFNTVVGYWDEDLSPAITISAMLAFYFILNIWRVDWYGEVEFWIGMGKVLLAIGFLFYTFITMVGGNPLHWAFGFHYWKNPGVWVGDNSVQQFEAAVKAAIKAGLIIVGPEFVSVLAGEARAPRKVVPRAFRTLPHRLLFFYIFGALCVGILVPHTDERLLGGGKYAAKSPYIISMVMLKIPVLPSIVNAALLTSILSAGNNYVFAASRSLVAMVDQGLAVRFFARRNRNGVPYIAVIFVLLIGCFAYMALGSGTSKFLDWVITFATAAQMINWCVMAVTWIRFNAGLKAQGVNRKEFLPAVSRWQPYAAWYTLCCSFVMLFVQGYGVFKPGNWDTPTFIFNYGLIAVFIMARRSVFTVVKVVKKTKFIKPEEIDFRTDVDIIDKYEAVLEEEDTGERTKMQKVMAKIF
ncbi:hypothetical protein CLAIMM_06665 [Cladophialophora immunda]|nr:hypothetical protein CLAIMM_06665 [Cladophialophora immunda]